jgi:hypothetical protein
VTVTRLTAGGGVVVLGVLCWLAATGFTALTAVLVTGAALVVMIGGGNWLSGRTTPERPPRPAAGDRSPAGDVPGAPPAPDGGEQLG